MKKSIAFVLTMALLAGLMTGCAGSTVVVNNYDCTCAPGSAEALTPVVEETQAPTVTEGAVKTGLAVVATLGGNNASAEEEGLVEYDVTMVAVTVDDNGVITDCVIDSLGTSVTFDASGAVVSDLEASVATKNELGDNYGMVAYGGAVAEWYQQADALARFAVGKTMEELKSGAAGNNGYAQDADLATSATIYLGGYVSAVEAAVNNARHLGAQAGDKLVLTSINGLANNSAEGETAGEASLTSDVIAMTKNGDVITSAVIDSLAAAVSFDAAGVITSELAATSKNVLGENYGMKAWGGATYEWNEQAANFCAYITGMTPEEVAGIAVTETTVPAEADLAASCTISIGGFLALVAKAAQ